MLFQANRAYIASHLCEQRQVPASDCQGKCYLKKQLKKEEQRGQQSPSSHKRPVLDLTLMAEAYKLQPPFLLCWLPLQPPAYTIKVYPSPALSTFHPPEHMA